MNKQILFFILSVLCCSTTNAQQTKYIEDVYGIKGKIRHQSPLSDTALPKSGLYELKWRDIAGENLTTYFVKGQTKFHQPTGKWKWEEATWKQQVNVGTTVLPHYLSKGIKSAWEGNFKNGLFHDTWTFGLDSLHSDGKVIKKLLRIEINYSNGKTSGGFKVEDFTKKHQLKVSGQTTTNGLATGIWKFNYIDLDGISCSEERKYEAGLLLEIKRIKAGKTSTEHFHASEKKNSSAIHSDYGSLIGTLNFEQDEAGGIASELLHESLRNFFLDGWKLEAFPFEVTYAPPFFKRLEFPLTVQEIAHKQHVSSLVDSLETEISKVMVDHMSIHRTRSAALDTTVAYLDLLSTRLLTIRNFITHTDHPFFTYKRREASNFKELLFAINSNRFGEGAVHPDLKVTLHPIADSASIFSALDTLLVQHVAVLPKYLSIVEQAHLEVKQEAVLHALEEKMIDQLAIQQTFYANGHGWKKTIYERWIATEIPLLLEQYAQTDSFEDAKAIGNQILERLDSLDAWQFQVNALNESDSILKTTYTMLAYNPYTGVNDIPMFVKKRFYNSISTLLWPYIKKELEDALTWEQWTQAWNQQDQVYTFLIHFASNTEKAAKRVEKRIRTEKKPERMLRTIEHYLQNLKHHKQ